MRQILSILLISTFVFPIAPVSAQDVDSIPTLEERLSNMDAEVERVLDLNAANSSGPLLEQETSATDESIEAVRAKLLSLEPGTRIGVVLQDGEQVQGRLVEVADDAFCLSVESDNVEVNQRHYVRRYFGFEQVKMLGDPGPPEKVHVIPVDKRVEVVLLNGEKLRGRVLDVTEERFTLSLEGDLNREFTLDEVESVRELEMPGWKKALIIGGAVFGGLLLIGLISYSNAL